MHPHRLKKGAEANIFGRGVDKAYWSGDVGGAGGRVADHGSTMVPGSSPPSKATGESLTLTDHEVCSLYINPNNGYWVDASKSGIALGSHTRRHVHGDQQQGQQQWSLLRLREQRDGSESRRTADLAGGLRSYGR